MLGLLVLCASAFVTPTTEVSSIEVTSEHHALAWRVTLEPHLTNCIVEAWLGRMGEQPLTNLVVVELDETVAPTAEGETPLLGLPPGQYDLHVEGGGCRFSYRLVSG